MVARPEHAAHAEEHERPWQLAGYLGRVGAGASRGLRSKYPGGGNGRTESRGGPGGKRTSVSPWRGTCRTAAAERDLFYIIVN